MFFVNDLLKNIGSILLLGLLLLKLSAFHIYEEHDSLNGQDTHCEFCLLVIENQQLETTVISSPIIDEVFVEPIHLGTITTVDLQVYLGPSKKEQLPRPPPTI